MVAASQQQPVPRQRLLNKVLWAAIKCFCPLAYSQSMTGERVKRRGKREKGEKPGRADFKAAISGDFKLLSSAASASATHSSEFAYIIYTALAHAPHPPLPHPCVCCRLQLVDVWRKLFQLTWQQVKNR